MPVCVWNLRLSFFAPGWQCKPAGMPAKSAGQSEQRESKVSFHTSKIINSGNIKNLYVLQIDKLFVL
jgi:hypothetical protein